MSSPRRRKIDQDSTPGSERTAIIERLGFGVGEVFETKRVRLALSPPRSERTATERLGFGGGRVLATKRSEPCLRRKPTISGLDGLPVLKRRDSMQDDEKLKGEAAKSPRCLKKYNSALEKERDAVEMQMLALTNAIQELELERIALDRRRVEVDEEEAQVNRLIASTRRNLRRINDQIGKRHAKK